jgi:anti-sigma regulatory factor (Ser/Thr protein kinase)
LIRQALAEYPTDTIDSAELLVSELVANAVQHAETGLVLHIQMSAAGVRVTVEDASGDSPSPAAEASPDTDERGRGLQIVNALASSWGWDRLPTGKRVWFELQ